MSEGPFSRDAGHMLNIVGFAKNAWNNHWVRNHFQTQRVREQPNDSFPMSKWSIPRFSNFSAGESQYAQVSDEMISKLTTSALASIDVAGYKVSAQSYIDPTSKGKSWVDFRVLDPSVGNPLVEVLDDISSWNVGKITVHLILVVKRILAITFLFLVITNMINVNVF